MSRRRPTPAETAAAFAVVAGRPGTLVEIAARASRTWTQYAAVLQIFLAWCSAKGVSMPPPSVVLRDWLLELASKHGLKVETVNAYHAALRTAFRLRGWPFEKAMLNEACRAVRRMFASPKRRAKPISTADLKALLAGLVPVRLDDARDAALLAVGWAKLLRQAELTGLDWHRPGDGLGYLRIDGNGARIVLLRSKTAQDRDWSTTISRADMPAAVAAIEHWAAVAKLKPSAPIFRPIIARRRVGERRLNPDAACAIIRRRVRRYCLAAGIAEAEADELALEVSGHSLRAGGITSQHEAGVPIEVIQRQSRHRRLDTLVAYIRPAEEQRDDGLAKVGF
jgi:site-specific recombinase XerC